MVRGTGATKFLKQTMTKRWLIHPLEFNIYISNTFPGSVTSKDIKCGENSCDIDRTHCPVIATEALTTLEGTVLYYRLHKTKATFYYTNDFQFDWPIQ